MADVIQQDNRWKVSGEVLMDGANAMLIASQALPLSENTLIDFGGATELDTAAISLILEWKRRAAREAKQIRLVNVPETLKSLAHLYGVAEFVLN
jgi:phospholipid transport system transporter-binding protein